MSKKTKNMRQIFSKISMSLLCLTTYLFGSYVTLPLLDMNKLAEQNKLEELDYVKSITYNQLDTYSIFSLGLTSWIFSLILWRILGLAFKESINKLSEKKKHIFQSTTTFFIALIQAYVKTLNLREVAIESVSGDRESMYIWLIILIAGAFFLIWLIKINTDYGIGGASIFILMNIVINGMQGFFQFINESNRENLFSLSDWTVTISFIAILLLLIASVVSFERAELRLPLHRVMLQSTYSGMSYLPIKFISAGSLPIIYSLTIFQVVQLIIKVLSTIYSENYYLNFMVDNIVITSLTGISVYWIILMLLTYWFAKINLSVEDISKQMLQNGDYISEINPGKATLKYLQKKTRVYGIVNAIIYLILVGFPMLIGYINPNYYYLGTLPATVLILVVMVINFEEQLSVLRIPSKYISLFE